MTSLIDRIRIALFAALALLLLPVASVAAPARLEALKASVQGTVAKV